jgi:signal transduction histidine kinase
VRALKESAPAELEAFAAAVAHELRTPLAALSGEVDIALRRERSAAAYRDALARIAASVAELVELTSDLTFLGEQGDDDPLPARRARPDRMFARVVERYASSVATGFELDPSLKEIVVAGDEGLLARAVSLVVEHAVRHRRSGARLTIHARKVAEAPRNATHVEIVVAGGEESFWPHTWQCLAASPREAGHAPALGSGPLRLRTADRIIRRCGGSVHAVAAPGGRISVCIQLRSAEPA